MGLFNKCWSFVCKRHQTALLLDQLTLSNSQQRLVTVTRRLIGREYRIRVSQQPIEPQRAPVVKGAWGSEEGDKHSQTRKSSTFADGPECTSVFRLLTCSFVLCVFLRIRLIDFNPLPRGLVLFVRILSKLKIKKKKKSFVMIRI